ELGRLDQNGPVEQRPRPDRLGRDAGDAHAEPICESEARIQHDQVAVPQEGGVGHVEVVAATYGECAGGGAIEDEAAMVAVFVQRLLGDDDDGAGERAIRGGDRKSFKASVALDVTDEGGE